MDETPKPTYLGKTIATVGVGMVALSIILIFVGVSGAMFHNVLQIGGVLVAVVGVIVWKVMKK